MTSNLRPKHGVEVAAEEEAEAADLRVSPKNSSVTSTGLTLIIEQTSARRRRRLLREWSPRKKQASWAYYMASDSTNSTSTNTVHTTFVRSTPHLPKHIAHPCSTTTTTTTGSRSQTLKHNPVNPPPKLSQHKSSYHHPQSTHQNKKTKPQIANSRHYQPSG